MKKSFQFKWMLFALIGAYLLSACGGTLPQSTTSDGAPKVLASEIVFTGIVEQINGDQWVVSGQSFTVDPAAALDSGIAVGDIVKVEGTVSADGSVVALKVESSTVSDDNSNAGNANGDNSNANVNSNDDNSNNGNSNDDNSNAAGSAQDEVFGIVESMTTDSITVGGITYQLADFTEFKDAIAVGDQVKIHVIVNADGTFSIREIEKSDSLSGGDDNSNGGNSNGNSNDDHGNDNNGNDDNSGGGNGNGNDDNGGHGGGDDNGGNSNGGDG